MVSSGDGSEGEAPPVQVDVPLPQPAVVSDTPSDMAIGFVPHQGENRTARRAAVATWEPKKGQPSRRELWEQRKKHRRGTMKGKT